MNKKLLLVVGGIGLLGFGLYAMRGKSAGGSVSTVGAKPNLSEARGIGTGGGYANQPMSMPVAIGPIGLAPARQLASAPVASSPSAVSSDRMVTQDRPSTPYSNLMYSGGNTTDASYDDYRQ